MSLNNSQNWIVGTNDIDQVDVVIPGDPERSWTEGSRTGGGLSETLNYLGLWPKILHGGKFFY